MGQRHQLFVIARVGKHYYSLAAIHHQWLYGVSALRSCRRLLRIFSDPSNRITLKHELDLAVGFFQDQGPPPSKPPMYKDPETTACPFPFITTCLAVGAAYDLEMGQVHTIHELAFDTGFNQGDNNDGITVLDITDLTDVRYCFVTLFGHNDDIDLEHDQAPRENTPLTGREYLRGYYSDSHDIILNSASIIEALDNSPLIEVKALAETWPWGKWDVDGIATEPGKPDRQTQNLAQTKSLRDLAAAKLFSRLLQSTDDDFDASLLDNVQDLPGFQRTLKEYLLCHSEQVGPTRVSAHLLQLAYAGEGLLEWNSFTNLTPKTIKAALASDAMKSVTSIILTVPSHNPPEELVEALSSLSSLHTLQILDRPDRKDERISNQIFETFAESKQLPAINKLTLSGLYANGLRQSIWRPYRDNPKTPEAYPLVQLLVAHQGEDGEFMRSFGGPLEYFYLGDTALTPVKIAIGLLQYLATQIDVLPSRSGTGLQVAHCFSCGPIGIGDRDSLEIAPLPAEIYRVAKAAYHSSIFQGLHSKLRDLNPGTWTAVVSESRDTDWTNSNDGVTINLHFKYAFIRSKVAIQVDTENWRGTDIKPSEIEVVDLEGFLQLIAPGVDTSKLAHHFDQLEMAVSRANNERTRITAPQDIPFLSMLSPEEACDLLEQFIASVPEVQKVANRSRSWSNTEHNWVLDLGFKVDK
ncbi:hypothetical protein EDB81DRAFT_705061 [Dactylonectria macrodidyma]|uniref:Uncharacterized protein n=1 Tax=Dactylonectria macrodidyma TaxID=307937 RepID=A0A9P9FSH7_9HYPO|nr:hypothetical protein EDB81DRAFT_705061 [Dactylonectria macrodidyma]